MLLYSDRWLQSVPYFQVLCIAGLASCLISVNTQPIAAIGKSRTMFGWTVIKRFFGISFVVIGLLFWGMKGLLVGVVLNTWFSYLVNIWLVSKYIGYKWTRQLLDLVPIALASLFAAAVSYSVGLLLGWGLYPDGIIKLLVYLVVYLGWSFVFKPESYLYFLTIVPQRFRYWEKTKKTQ